MQYRFHLLALLLAWIVFRLVTVVVLPLVRERRGWIPGRALSRRGPARARSQDDAGGEKIGIATIAAGAAMLAFVLLWLLAFLIRYGFGDGGMPPDIAWWSGVLGPVVIALGLVALAAGGPVRDVKAFIDYAALAALAAMLAFGMAGYDDPGPWLLPTAGLFLLAALLLARRAFGIAIAVRAGRGGRSSG